MYIYSIYIYIYTHIYIYINGSARLSGEPARPRAGPAGPSAGPDRGRRSSRERVGVDMLQI